MKIHIVEIPTIYYNGDIERAGMKDIRKIAGKCKGLLYRVIFCLSGDAKATIDHKIPMTQELFEYLFDFYLDMDDQRKVMKFMGKYPQFVDAYVKRI